MAYIINTAGTAIRLREGVFNDGLLLEPGEAREVGGLAEQIYRSGEGRPQSVVDRWGVPGLLVEDDPRCKEFLTGRLAGLKAVADSELADRAIAGTSTAERSGLKFRVRLPAAAAAHLAAIRAALEAATSMGAAALEVVVR